MENNAKVVLVQKKLKKPKKAHKFRDTVLVRVSRNIKEEIQEYSKQSCETMSQVIDWVLKDFLKTMR